MLKWELFMAPRAVHLLLRGYSTVPSTSSSDSVIHVRTTGYTYLNRDGRRLPKYGIYFGEGDARNRWEDIRGQRLTYAGARLYAIIQAIKTAYPTEASSEKIGGKTCYDKSGPKMHIRPDFDFRGWEYLEKLRQNDWKIWTTREHEGRRIRKQCEITHVKLWSELYELVQHRQEKITLDYVKPPANEPNAVTALLQAEASRKREAFSEPQKMVDFVPGNALHALKAEKVSPKMSADWPTVFTGGVVDWKIGGFESSAYATFWPKGDVPAAPGMRLNMYPISLFRAELCAIQMALEQARKAKLERVVVVTTCPYFLRHWYNGWRTITGREVANNHLYDRIYHLVQNSGMKVVFRYLEKDKDAPVWKHLDEQCQSGLLQPLMRADKSGPDMDEILERKCPEDLPVRRVRHFKRKKSKAIRLLWDKTNSSEETTHQTVESSKTVDALLAIGSKVKEENLDRLLIRTDSPKLIKEFEQWMPVWKRHGWRNGRNSFQDPRYEQADKLLSKTQIYWELVDPPTEEDMEILKQFTKTKQPKKDKVAKTPSSTKYPPKPMILEEIPVTPVPEAFPVTMARKERVI